MTMKSRILVLWRGYSAAVTMAMLLTACSAEITGLGTTRGADTDLPEDEEALERALHKPIVNRCVPAVVISVTALPGQCPAEHKVAL
jgi:hypothetical protein